MELKLYDTLTREKRVFTPLDPAHVRMYVCGPTVYDFAHIGNARPVIVFDVLFRLLRHLYGAEHVAYVRNITDVDDKINARAAEEYPGLPLNEAIRVVTEKTERQFHDDVAALGCLPPTLEPRATEHIDAMKALIERLIASGHAYVAEEHVLFSVPSMPDYGRLSRRSLDELIAGARVEVAPYKRDPTDFVLWKPSKPGEPAWPSPAGIAMPGRPGWHIECSAMSWQHLGEVFDIHGGGIDLVFPHHENEIAQSRCAFHTPVMANYWLHNGFLQVEGEKMAKSLGNFVTIRELLADWPGEVLRLNMLKTHYRQPVDWTLRNLEESASELQRWAVLMIDSEAQGTVLHGKRSGETQIPSFEVIGALCDDLNTPLALTHLREIFVLGEKRLLSALEFLVSAEFMGILRADKLHVHELGVGGIDLGPEVVMELDEPAEEFRIAVANDQFERAEAALARMRRLPVAVEADFKTGKLAFRGKEAAADSRIQSLIDRRTAARRAKDFKESDRIRDKLHAMGIELEDCKDGTTTWKVKR